VAIVSIEITGYKSCYVQNSFECPQRSFKLLQNHLNETSMKVLHVVANVHLSTM